MLYAAYGSNLNLMQMGWRCPSARVVGTGFITGYRLEFRRYLTIVPDEKGEVPVALWELTDQDEKALDQYEGFPHFYHKEMICVETKTGAVKALVYIMNSGEPALPTSYYLDAVKVGYDCCGFDKFYLKEALEKIANK